MRFLAGKANNIYLFGYPFFHNITPYARMDNNVDRFWSVITPTPIGYREFCYSADERMTISHKHPTTSDGARNWRTVCGPPPPARNQKRAFETRLHLTMERLADNLRAFLIPTTVPKAANKRRKLNKSFSEPGTDDVESAWPPITNSESIKGKPLSPEQKSMFRLLVLAIRLVLACLLMYATVVFGIRLRQVLR